MLRIFYTFLLTTLLTNCKAQETADNFQQNINEMKQYKTSLANEDALNIVENKLIVDISGGIKKVKINDKTVDSLGFRKVLSQFLTTHKNKASLLVAGSFDHASMDNIVVFTRVFNQCKTLFDPNDKSKICFKTFKDFAAFNLKTVPVNGH